MKRTAICCLGFIILLYAVVPMTSFATQIFVVKVQVIDANGNPIDGLDVTVKNTSKPIPAQTGPTGQNGPGIYSAVFFNLKVDVAASGDEILVTVMEEGEAPVEVTYIVTDDDIAAASAEIDIRIESRVPAPIIDSVASDSGTIFGGDAVQLFGENFQEGASVTVGGIEISDVEYISPSEFSITLPEDTVGMVEIVLTNPDGQSVSFNIEVEARIPAPILDGVTSESGKITEGTIVQLIGENFQEGASVTVGGIEISDVEYISPSEFSITLPEDTVGMVEIVLTNPDGQSVSFNIEVEARIPAPILDGVTSESGKITEGTIVQLIGENFQEGASVTVGGIRILDVEYISPTEITFTIPASTVGNVEIVLTNPDGQSQKIAFSYVEFRPEDINRDEQIDIFDLVKVGSSFGQTGEGLAADIDGNGEVDIFDLVRVARLFGQSGIVSAAPSARAASGRFDFATARESIQQEGTHSRTTPMGSDTLSRLRSALTELERISDTMPEVRIGADLLRNWLATNAGIPAKTQLLPNYPNPFNPETWIPYHLDRDANTALSIYNAGGVLVRQFDLGHQSAGFYTEKGNAVYWDGQNERGEAVASGTYFYRLRAGDYSAMRRMVIVK